MCTAEDNPVVYMRAPCEAQVAAETSRKVQDNTDEGLSILPPSLRKHFLDSLSRNSGAFKKLSKM
jgi:hypothetical protein